MIPKCERYFEGWFLYRVGNDAVLDTNNITALHIWAHYWHNKIDCVTRYYDDNWYVEFNVELTDNNKQELFKQTGLTFVLCT